MNKLVERAMPHESAIRQNYIAEIMGMQNCFGVRDEAKWDFFCDQDQLYYLAYYAVPELEKLHDDNQDDHNQFTDWLNALFSVEAAVLGFDGSV